MNYKKIKILRTNALIGRPKATLKFGNDNCIVIPMPVIDELEKRAGDYTERGKNAKNVLDYLNRFDMRKLMSPEGIIQENGSILRIENSFSDIKLEGDVLPNLTYLDKRSLQIAIGLKQNSGKRSVELISKNAALRLKAKSLGIKASDIKDDIFPRLEEQYTGRVNCQLSRTKMDKFFTDGFLLPKDIYNNYGIEWMPNLFLSMTVLEDTKTSALAKFDGEKIVPLVHSDEHPFGISTKKAGQIMALEALLESPETAPLVIIKGGAGTGKTYLSLAVALDKTIEDNPIYSRILITAPTDTIGGKDLGYLPGELEEKFNPHLGGIMDNLRVLFSSDRKDKASKGKSNKSKSSYHHKFSADDCDDPKSNYVETGQYLFDSGIMEMQLIAYLRGRSITNTIFIIDETQNIHPDDIKSIVTRASTGSKFIFLGDPTQIDNPELNEQYNGLVYLSEKTKESTMAYTITLTDEESVRSPLAKYAQTVL